MEQHDNGHHDYDGITEDREQSAPVYFNVLFSDPFKPSANAGDNLRYSKSFIYILNLSNLYISQFHSLIDTVPCGPQPFWEYPFQFHNQIILESAFR